MRRTVTVPLYGITVVFTDSFVEARNEYRKHLTTVEAYEDSKAGAEAVDPELASDGIVRTVSNVVVVCVEDVSCLIHELSHAAFEVCECVGIPIWYKNQEPHAYLTQWLYDQWRRVMK